MIDWSASDERRLDMAVASKEYVEGRSPGVRVSAALVAGTNGQPAVEVPWRGRHGGAVQIDVNGGTVSAQFKVQVTIAPGRGSWNEVEKRFIWEDPTVEADWVDLASGTMTLTGATASPIFSVPIDVFATRLRVLQVAVTAGSPRVRVY